MYRCASMLAIVQSTEDTYIGVFYKTQWRIREEKQLNQASYGMVLILVLCSPFSFLILGNFNFAHSFNDDSILNLSHKNRKPSNLFSQLKFIGEMWICISSSGVNDWNQVQIRCYTSLLEFQLNSSEYAFLHMHTQASM